MVFTLLNSFKMEDISSNGATFIKMLSDFSNKKSCNSTTFGVQSFNKKTFDFLSSLRAGSI